MPDARPAASIFHRFQLRKVVDGSALPAQGLEPPFVIHGHRGQVRYRKSPSFKITA